LGFANSQTQSGLPQYGHLQWQCGRGFLHCVHKGYLLSLICNLNS